MLSASCTSLHSNWLQHTFIHFRTDSFVVSLKLSDSDIGWDIIIIIIIIIINGNNAIRKQ